MSKLDDLIEEATKEVNIKEEEKVVDENELTETELYPQFNELKLSGKNLAMNYVSAFNTGMNVYQCLNYLQAHVNLLVKTWNEVMPKVNARLIRLEKLVKVIYDSGYIENEYGFMRLQNYGNLIKIEFHKKNEWLEDFNTVGTYPLQFEFENVEYLEKEYSLTNVYIDNNINWCNVMDSNNTEHELSVTLGISNEDIEQTQVHVDSETNKLNVNTSFNIVGFNTYKENVTLPIVKTKCSFSTTLILQKKGSE